MSSAWQRYRARSDRQRLGSTGVGAPDGSDNTLVFFGVLLIIIMGNLIAWCAGVWW